MLVKENCCNKAAIPFSLSKSWLFHIALPEKQNTYIITLVAVGKKRSVSTTRLVIRIISEKRIDPEKRNGYYYHRQHFQLLQSHW